jgi:23S rRNA (guanosine2251-2'-O)-methyltransferase
MVVEVGFEPTYATRADLQSAAFNHSATPPDCHFHRMLFACKTTTILRDKKAQLICQQRSRLMASKSTKKQYSAKNPHRNRQKPIPNRGDVYAGGERHNASKRSSHHGQTRKTAPKPPQNGYFIWGRHAVFAALANPDRRIQQLYVVADSADSLETEIGHLDRQRQNDIPTPQVIERERLDGIGGASEKAVHQGIAAAVWPLDPPYLDDFLAGLAASKDITTNPDCASPVRLLLLDQLSDPRNVGAIMRSARAFGVAGLITTFRNAAEENGVLARTASGALDHVPLIRVVNLARTIEQLQDNGFLVAGLAGEGDVEVGALTAHQRLAIMLGAEGSGLRRLSRDHCDMLVRININDDAESLNVSNAAAIALYAASLYQAD